MLKIRLFHSHNPNVKGPVIAFRDGGYGFSYDLANRSLIPTAIEAWGLNQSTFANADNSLGYVNISCLTNRNLRIKKANV